MKPAILLLTILIAGGAIVWLIDRLFYHKDEVVNDNPSELAPSQGSQARQGCADQSCSLRSICPSEQLLAGACKQEVTYYDDEELDDFKGRGENDYSPEEEEQWRDVLYTLRPEDLLGWGQSVMHRSLVMPAAIKQEFLQLAGEQHFP